MDRTIPSFRNVLAMEKKEWKPFRNALDRKERKEFDETWDIAKLYISACCYDVQYGRSLCLQIFGHLITKLTPSKLSILHH
jgi:hypothetical protein